MKAAVLDHYDKKNIKLRIADVPVPVIKDDEVLIRVRTAGVNPVDNMIARGEVRMIVPYKVPQIMGNELCGIIEKTGKDVRGLHVGDRVYTRMPLKQIGAFAEYAAFPASAVARVPDYLTDEEAAAVPLTALTALQALDLMHPKHGDTIFISGGSGSLGAMAIPIAKSMGMIVYTNGSAANKDRVLSLGADQYMDYKSEDYGHILHDVDFVLDTLGDRELAKEFRILKPGGTLVSVKGLPDKEFAKRSNMHFWKRLLFSLAGRKYVKMAARKHQHYYFMFVHEDGRGLQKVNEIFKDHHLHVSVDQVFSLDHVNDALEKVANGHSKGKTILKINAE